MEIKIDLSFLRIWQKEVFKNFKRFNILVIHRRAGKTVTAICLLLYKASREKWSYWYIAPTYKQSKAIAFDILTKLAKKLPRTEVNISELTITLFNWSKIRLFWADYPDSLRWLDLKWVVFDEYAQQPSSIYWEIIFPMINANDGWCLWIGTPKWKNAFYHLYERWLKDDKFYVKLLNVSQTWLLNEEQLKAAKEEMTEEEYNQEYNCSWTASIKWAVYWKELSIAYEEWRIRKWIYDPEILIDTFWDLWISDATTILFTQRVWKEIRIFDSYKKNWFWLEHYAKIIEEKWYKYNKHYFPHDIKHKELWTWMSRLDIAIKLLWNNCAVVPITSIETWINAWRYIFKYLYIEESLEELLNDLSLYQYEYDDKIWDFKKTPKHDFTSHYADAYRYLAMTFDSLLRNDRVLEHNQDELVFNPYANKQEREKTLDEVIFADDEIEIDFNINDDPYN